MKKASSIVAILASSGLFACLHTELDSCLAAPTYGCLIDQAEKAANGLGPEFERINAFAYIVRVVAVTGRQEDARKYMAVLERSATDGGGPRIVSASLVRAYASMNQLHRARNYAAQITKPNDAGLAYAWLADNEARLGDNAGARESIDRAHSLARGLDAGDSAAVLASIAVAEVSAAKPLRAVEAATTARALALSRAAPYRQVGVLATGAVALFEAGYRSEASQFLGDASNAAQTVEADGNVSQHAVSLAYLAWAQAITGEAEPARRSLERLLKLVPDLRSPLGQSLSLAAAAMALAHIDSWAVDAASRDRDRPTAANTDQSSLEFPERVLSD